MISENSNEGQSPDRREETLFVVPLSLFDSIYKSRERDHNRETLKRMPEKIHLVSLDGDEAPTKRFCTRVCDVAQFGNFDDAIRTMTLRF